METAGESKKWMAIEVGRNTDEQVFDEVVCGSHPSESESFDLLTFC